MGQKAFGLSEIPDLWRPPFIVLKSSVYAEWIIEKASHARKKILKEAAHEIYKSSRSWSSNWPRGIILRSSASKETMNDRGAFTSKPLAASYDEKIIIGALTDIYESFASMELDEELAIIIQALAPKGFLGHTSNERRVSKTINHWEWSFEDVPEKRERFNSQRSSSPEKMKGLEAKTNKQFKKLLRSVGRWATSLNRGPTHMEWSWDNSTFWILQIDFEDETPDIGINPKELIRDIDTRPSGQPPDDSFVTKLDINGALLGWKKADNIRDFASIREDKYPDLFTIKGTDILEALRNKDKLEKEFENITHGRAVCRTDCNCPEIDRFNLPRTDSIDPKRAVEFLDKTYLSLISRGAQPKDICFIIHKFIPAISSAWAMADPDKQTVIIDSLWGVPDGLQYYPHDSFQVDVKLNRILSERTRFKPFFIQELENGDWKKVHVKRSAARSVSLSRADLFEIAHQTKLIASNANGPISVMWFCDIPKEVGIGKNLPWFAAPPEAKKSIEKAAPVKKQFVIRNAEDINRAELEAQDHILVLEPEVPFIRDNSDFLQNIVELSKRLDLPVQVQGSTLGHAFYILQREGVTVFPSDAPKYERTRGRQTFHKMVRDSIPSKISEGGEIVAQTKIRTEDTRSALIVKLLEEAFELKDAQTPDQMTEELADVLEVVKSLAEAGSIEWSDVQIAADKKRKERGSFKDNIVLLETSWPSEKKMGNIPQFVPLKSLSKKTNINGGVEISFPSILASTEDANITLPSGLDIKISLSSSGLLITENTQDDEIENQFSFMFMEQHEK